MVTLGDCFSGIGGNSIGFLNVFPDGKILWGSELNENKYGRYLESLSLKHFPSKVNLGDITKIENPPEVTILDGGFPCQDISQVNCHGASGTSGIKSNLYTHQLRIAKECKPKYIHFENSWMICQRGLNNVLFDLYKMGYHVQWKTVSLFHFGLPHARLRTYIIAYKDNPTSDDIFDMDFEKFVFFSPYNIRFKVGMNLDERLTFIHDDLKGEQKLLVPSDPMVNHRLNALGNSVHTIASTWVHHAMKRHMNHITTEIPDLQKKNLGHIGNFMSIQKTYPLMPLSGMMIDGVVYETETPKIKKPKETIPTPVRTVSHGWEDAFCWAKYNSKDRKFIGKTSLISQDPTLLFKKLYLEHNGVKNIKDIDDFRKNMKPNLPNVVVNPNFVEILMGFPIDWTKEN